MGAVAQAVDPRILTAPSSRLNRIDLGIIRSSRGRDCQVDFVNFSGTLASHVVVWVYPLGFIRRRQILAVIASLRCVAGPGVGA